MKRPGEAPAYRAGTRQTSPGNRSAWIPLIVMCVLVVLCSRFFSQFHSKTIIARFLAVFYALLFVPVYFLVLKRDYKDMEK